MVCLQRGEDLLTWKGKENKLVRFLVDFCSCYRENATEDVGHLRTQQTVAKSTTRQFFLPNLACLRAAMRDMSSAS